LPAPIDDQGRYRVILSNETLARLGFSLAGARELLSAQPLAHPADRRRLAALLGGRDALAAGQQLSQRGISRLGAQEIVRAAPVTDYWDRWRIVRLLGGITAAPGGRTALETYDFPGDYAGRFDGVDK
jgi:hypothetical protein